MPPGFSVSSRAHNISANQMNAYPGDHWGRLNNILQHQLPHQSYFIPGQLIQPQHQWPVAPSFSHVSWNPQLYHPHLASSPARSQNLEAMLGLGDFSNQRLQFTQNSCSWRNDLGWPRFSSKYMTSDEIRNTLRLQIAATHRNDPYVDDYYHQACLAKKSVGGNLRRHFCPINLEELPPRARADGEPYTFLQVDALGRISFSSIRRPCPLLEVDSSNSSSPTDTTRKVFKKPLEQDPMLAARVAIEDGICLLLDVDDIDRFMQFNQVPHGGMQMKRRRQCLLEKLATSLQLVDPLGQNGHASGLASEGDLLFLQLLSLHKGRKLLARYLKVLSPNDELMRIVCMTICRHLRSLFGELPSDNGAAGSSINLARVVSSCVHGMDLGALSACLAAVVCSSEQPPLRRLGSPSGDGASVVIISILERATVLLMVSQAAANFTIIHRQLWKASFGEFFGLLTKYCVNKYDSIMQSLHVQAPANMSVMGSDAAKAIRREMPVELLRASLPLTDEHQRKLLLDFAQRSMPIVGFSNQEDGNSGKIKPGSVTSL